MTCWQIDCDTSRFYVNQSYKQVSKPYDKVHFQEISILPPWKVCLFFSPLPPPNSSLSSYFASKILAFKNPLPEEISDDLPWGGYKFFFWNYTIVGRGID